MPAETTSAKHVAVRWLYWLACVPFLLAAAAYAYFVVFSRPMSPDEGYLMITVRSFLSEGSLYDTVYTQYGPFYYCYEWFLHAVLSVPLTHDATRWLCAAHWLGAATLLGFAGWRMTGSAFGGLLVFTQAVVHLAGLATEPGHPQELVALLLAAALWMVAGGKRAMPPLLALGGIAALLAFTKINVGVFFGIAVLLTLRAWGPDRLSRRLWGWVTMLLCAAAPLVLMRSHLGAEWCRNFSLVLSAAIVGSIVMTHWPSLAPASKGKLHGRVAVGFLSVAGVLIGVTLATGTSWRGLADGLFLTPLKMSGVALLPLTAPVGVLANAALALAAAISFRWLGGRANFVVTLLKGCYAALGLFLWLGEVQAQILWLLPWVWLVGSPVGDQDDGASQNGFARTFLSMAAAWQALQAYPIAGSQVTIATLLLVVSYVVCAADVWRELAARPWWRGLSAGWPAGRVRLAQAFMVLGLLLVFTNHWCGLRKAQAHHASLPRLDLPGSHLVRMEAETAGMYRALSGYLRTNCETFVSYPGINSLHFWSGRPPPTHINGTGWGQLSPGQQERILQALRESKRPLLVVVEAAMQSWNGEGPAPIRPLVRFVRQNCRPIARLDRFLVFEPLPTTNRSTQKSSLYPESLTARPLE